MAEEQDRKTGSARDQATLETDTFLDLNFVPQWARRPPDAVHAARFSDGDSSRRVRPARADRTDRGGRDSGGRERRVRPARTGKGESGAASVGREQRRDPDGARVPSGRSLRSEPQGAARPVAGVSGGPTVHVGAAVADGQELLHAQFLPERKAVLGLTKRIAGSHKAYPLLDLAGVVLAREGLCYVRLEVQQEAGARCLFQCQLCRTVALAREDIAMHIVEDHLADYFAIETETVDPPAGVFVCVAICGMSGKLLGPPNHHSYGEAVKAMHAEQFSHMDIEQYRGRIRVSHDPADVERWKAACTTRTVYRRTVVEGEEEPAAPVSHKEAQRFMREEIVPRRIKSLRRVVLREAEAHAVQDPLVRGVLHRAWQREVRFPIQVALALRAALRGQHLHVFKAGGGKGMHFVTGVKPVALDPDTAVPAIREALRYLEEHPGCTREEMLEDLVGHVNAEEPRARELLQPIHWLTERGHIIEFFNGRLAVPRHV